MTGKQRTELADLFARAREREANGALLVVGLAKGAGRNPATLGEAAGPVIFKQPDIVRHELGESAIGCILPDCSAPEARSKADAIRTALAPAPVCVGIVNFYEFFAADGTLPEIVREIERVARDRLETARRGPGTVCDTSDPAAPRTEYRPSVFVIEPDPVSVELLTAALDAAGFAVSSFQNGEAAIASLEASRPDLVICEVMTPRMNGFVIRERLRASPRLEAIPFILVSHRKTEEMIRRAVELDIRHFFRKPLSIVEIVGLAANLTRSPSS
jgi:two-component system cell cycle response regulator